MTSFQTRTGEQVNQWDGLVNKWLVRNAPWDEPIWDTLDGPVKEWTEKWTQSCLKRGSKNSSGAPLLKEHPVLCALFTVLLCCRDLWAYLRVPFSAVPNKSVNLLKVTRAFITMCCILSFKRLWRNSNPYTRVFKSSEIKVIWKHQQARKKILTGLCRVSAEMQKLKQSKRKTTKPCCFKEKYYPVLFRKMMKHSVGMQGFLKYKLGSCGIKDLLISMCYWLPGKQHTYKCLVLALHLHRMTWAL